VAVSARRTCSVKELFPLHVSSASGIVSNPVLRVYPFHSLTSSRAWERSNNEVFFRVRDSFDFCDAGRDGSLGVLLRVGVAELVRDRSPARSSRAFSGRGAWLSGARELMENIRWRATTGRADGRVATST